MLILNGVRDVAPIEAKDIHSVRVNRYQPVVRE